jgi:hypothetical protein
MLLVLVLDLEQQTAVLDGKLRDYCNCLVDLAVLPDNLAVYFLEDPPHFKLPIDCLVARLDAGLHPLVLDGVARVVRELSLVGGANVAIVGLNVLAWLEEVQRTLLKILMLVNFSAG